MQSNVAGDNNAVNANICARLVGAMTDEARPYHHGNLRTALLERGGTHAAERGVDELSLRELAREAGVSHAAPRRHFADRQALLDALAERVPAARAELRGRGRRRGRGVRAAPDGVVTAYIRFATEDAALLELMFAGKHRPDAAGELREAADRAFAAPLALLTDAQAHGEVVADDPEGVAAVTFSVLQGLVALVNGGMLAEAEVEQLLPSVVRRLVLGLRPR